MGIKSGHIFKWSNKTNKQRRTKSVLEKAKLRYFSNPLGESVTEEILDKQRLADAICQLEDGTLKLVLEKVKQSIEPILLELN